MGRSKSGTKKSPIISLVKLGAKPDFDSIFQKALKIASMQDLYGYYGWDDYDEAWWEYAYSQQNNDPIGGGVCMLPSQRAESLRADRNKHVNARMNTLGLLWGQGDKFAKGKGTRRGPKKGQKTNKRKNVWEQGFFGDMEIANSLSEREEKPVVYFYKWYENPDDVECFMNLADFNDFLEREGIHCSDKVVCEILQNEENHCCIDPSSKWSGDLELMVNDTYYGMKWDASIADTECENYEVMHNRS